MKKWLVLAVILLLTLATYVAAGPYLTVRAIRSAVVAQDAAALSRQIDFPALRTSLKAQINDRMVRRAGADMQASPLGAFGMTIAGAVAGSTVDAMVTPMGLGAMVQGRILWQRLDDGLSSMHPSSMDPSISAASTPAPEPLHDPLYRYESTSRFTATVRDGNGRPVVYVLTRHGLQWQLSDIRLPQ